MPLLSPTRSGRRRRSMTVLLVSLTSLGSSLSTLGSAGNVDEIRVRIAFLLNFAKFTSWPDRAIAGSKEFRIGVLGDDVLVESLRELTRDRTVKGLPILVVSARRPDDLRSCHLAFFGVESGTIPAQIRALAGLPVLTVSTAEGFLSHGGMIELFMKDNRIRFSISAKVVESAGLHISADLQALASSR